MRKGKKGLTTKSNTCPSYAKFPDIWQEETKNQTKIDLPKILINHFNHIFINKNTNHLCFKDKCRFSLFEKIGVCYSVD
ncbi:hypothetical protein EB008_02480 [bacterium]|nr:hypothetical protein [bacterium]